MSSVGHAIILLQLTSTVGQLAVAYGLPTSARQASNSSPPETCQDRDVYWDGENCKVCITCPPGDGSNAGECGYGIGEKGICEPCVEGETYQEDWSATGPCKTCTSCDENATVQSNCTVAQNTVCGPCKPGYGSDPNHPGTCSRCIFFNDEEKPPECQTTPAPADPLTTTLPPSTYLPTTSATSGGASGGAGDMAPSAGDMGTSANSDSGDTTFQITTPADPGSSKFPVAPTVAIPSVAIVILLVALLLCCVKRQRRRSRRENGKSPKSESGTKDEKLGLTATRNGVESTVTTAAEGQHVQDSAAATSSMANGDLPGQHEPTLHDGIAGRTRPDVHSSGGIPTQEIPCTGACPVDVNKNCSKTTDNLSTVAAEAEQREELLPSAAGQTDAILRCTGPNVPSDRSPAVLSSPLQVVNDSNPEFPVQSSTGDDVTDSNCPVQDPHVLSSIPEKNIPESSTGSCKKLKRVKEFAHRTFMRSLSEPAKENTPPSSPSVQTDVGASPLELVPAVRSKLMQTRNRDEENKYKNDLNKACSIGSDLHWDDLEPRCKRIIRQMLTPSNPLVSSYKQLGESFGLDRNTVLKSCNNIEDVFEVLGSMRKVTLEEVLLKLHDDIDRKDVVKELCQELLFKKPKCKCNGL